MEEYDDIKSFLEASILTLGSPFVPSDEVVQSLKNIPSPTVAVVAQRSMKLKQQLCDLFVVILKVWFKMVWKMNATFKCNM